MWGKEVKIDETLNRINIQLSPSQLTGSQIDGRKLFGPLGQIARHPCSKPRPRICKKKDEAKKKLKKYITYIIRKRPNKKGQKSTKNHQQMKQSKEAQCGSPPAHSHKFIVSIEEPSKRYLSRRKCPRNCGVSIETSPLKQKSNERTLAMITVVDLLSDHMLLSSIDS